MWYRSVIISLVVVAAFTTNFAFARSAAIQQLCVNCHTMHNSQKGDPMATATGFAQGGLLKDSCYGCHSDSQNNSSGSVPFVLKTTAPAPVYNDIGTESPSNEFLAGGNFYWVSVESKDLMGHNVNGIASQAGRTAPGGTEYFDGSRPLTCAGQNGCHGDSSILNETISMSQTHHSDVPVPTDGSPIQVINAYRFLEGIAGIEDPDRELTASPSNHNQYKGVARNADNDPDTTSMSHFCARCHGDFHNDNGSADVNIAGIAGAAGFSSPWIRHPVDYSMAAAAALPGSEFADYGGTGVNDYNIATPLASSNLATGVVQTVYQVAGDAIITCVSCHRAHGSPFDYSMRWNYKAWPGAGYNGCGDCHTLKN
ncbi:MAG: hypothetical protein KJ950_04175 [Proteobacteria bacterium]|nr:hypothetical protein [Pseudomonadota bacterium]MBU1688462.1 hypothetical protein [Pseudomonadota bacterium]